MKLEIEIDDAELKEVVIQKLAEKCIDQIWGRDYIDEKETLRKRQEILSKIDWKNAGSQLSETVVQKFFMKLLDNK